MRRRWLLTAALVAGTVWATMRQFRRDSKETIIMVQHARATWYLPEIYNGHFREPTPCCWPPTLTPTITLTPTSTSTVTATPTATLQPTRTPLPWPEGDVPSAVPYEVWLNVLEITRSARRIEGWNEVFEDVLVIMAGNNSWGAQLSPIVNYYDDGGHLWRGMETCQGLLVETPEGWVWFLRGYYGPIIQVWPRTYNITAGE